MLPLPRCGGSECPADYYCIDSKQKGPELQRGNVMEFIQTCLNIRTSKKSLGDFLSETNFGWVQCGFENGL